MLDTKEKARYTSSILINYALNDEALKRRCKVNPIAQESLTQGIDKWWFGDYNPTPEALEINRKRIEERLK